jgi:hypothetical protein
MKQTSSPFRRIILHQWDFLCVAVLLGLAAIAWSALFPLGRAVFFSIKNMSGAIAFISKGDSVAVLAEMARVKADRIDSCLKSVADSQALSEQAVPGAIYGLAGSAGIKASKVEIAPTISAAQGAQIPVDFRGEGEYGSCGKFVDGIENLRPAGRIRELNMKNGKNGMVELFMDFVILSQK